MHCLRHDSLVQRDICSIDKGQFKFPDPMFQKRDRYRIQFSLFHYLQEAQTALQAIINNTTA